MPSQNQGYYPAKTYPVYSDPGYGYGGAGPVVYGGGPVVCGGGPVVYGGAGPVEYGDGDSVAYCEQTYRSYDPASGTTSSSLIQPNVPISAMTRFGILARNGP